LICRVLGPLEIEIDGVVVDLGGRTPRRLLAALIAADGATVADSVLAEMVWGSDAPTNLVNTLRVLVSRLRTALGPGARHHLQRYPLGYSFAAPPETTDYGRFSRFVNDGRRWLSEGDAQRAVDAFESALPLWRGHPWPELDNSRMASSSRAGLVELRELAVEELQSARLKLGDTATAVAALSQAVPEAPYRERRWELLALGLYRGGRQAHALAELRRVRELLVDELGIEPGPALRELERRILAHDPSLMLSKPPARPIQGLDPAPAIGYLGSTPRPLSSLVGRDHELKLIEELLGAQRLVTLLGPAGVGKTRLAVEHTGTALAHGEVWLVRLADVRTAADVAAAAAAALGVVHLAGDPIVLMRRALAGRAGVLVLDNCEHLIDAVGEFVVQLLAGCPELRILATSRGPIEVDGEHTLTLEPLPVLDEFGADGAAVELLFDRMRASGTSREPNSAERAAAREVCQILDGLPLAIELAAARARAFGLGEIAVYLRERLDVLGSAAKGSLTSHASLHAAIGWSVDQLRPPDRALLLRLWPFEGGFSWDAAEAVQPRDAGGHAVLAVLASLVNRSVITAETSARPARYRMLETIRRYCRDADPDLAATERAHAAWVADLVAEQTALLTGPHAGQGYRALATELANIRAGITHDLEHRPTEALRTSAALEWAWVGLAAPSDGVRLISAALDACPDAPVEDRVRGLLALSISFQASDPAEAVRLADSAIKVLGEPTTDRALLRLKALMYRGANAVELGDPVLALSAVDQFVAEMQRGPAPEWMQSNARLWTGMVQLLQGNRAEGEATLETAEQSSELCGYLWGQGTAAFLLGWSLLADSDRDRHRAREALHSLNRAMAVFEHEANMSDLLGVIYAGAHAMIELAPPDTAVRLRAAAVEHAARIGVGHRRYAHLTGAGVEGRVERLLPPHQQAAAEQAGKAMSWPAMVQLFTDTVARLPAEPHPAHPGC